MKNKIALVISGTDKVGTAICQHLADAGAMVIATYNKDYLAAKDWLIKQNEMGYGFVIGHMDICDLNSCIMLIQNVITKLGAIDILVNNAITSPNVARKQQDRVYKETPVHLDILFEVMLYIINGMNKKGYGRIINIMPVSKEQNISIDPHKDYNRFSNNLFFESIQNGVTVNTICSDYSKTNVIQSLLNKLRQRTKNSVSIDSYESPNDIAKAVGYLASEENGYITGSNLVIHDGKFKI